MNTSTTQPGLVVRPKPLRASIDVLLRVEVHADGKCQAILSRRSVLPYLPRKHDELGLGRDGDYMTVDILFWDPEDGFIVYFMDLHNPSLVPRLQAEGWTLEP